MGSFLAARASIWPCSSVRPVFQEGAILSADLDAELGDAFDGLRTTIRLAMGQAEGGQGEPGEGDGQVGSHGKMVLGSVAKADVGNFQPQPGDPAAFQLRHYRMLCHRSSPVKGRGRRTTDFRRRHLDLDFPGANQGSLWSLAGFRARPIHQRTLARIWPAMQTIASRNVDREDVAPRSRETRIISRPKTAKSPQNRAKFASDYAGLLFDLSMTRRYDRHAIAERHLTSLPPIPKAEPRLARFFEEKRWGFAFFPPLPPFHARKGSSQWMKPRPAPPLWRHCWKRGGRATWWLEIACL